MRKGAFTCCYPFLLSVGRGFRVNPFELNRRTKPPFCLFSSHCVLPFFVKSDKTRIKTFLPFFTMSVSNGFNCSLSPNVERPWQSVDYSQARIDFCLALYIVLMVCCVVFSMVFYWGKKIVGFERLRVRRSVLVYSLTLAFMIHAQVGPLFIVVGMTNYPCLLRSVLTLLIVPLMGASVVVRLLVYFFMNELSKSMMANYHAMRDVQNEAATLKADVNSLHRFARGFCDVSHAIFFLVCGSTSQLTETLSKERTVTALLFVASAKGTFVILFIMLIPFIIVAIILAISDPAYTAGCTGCRLSSGEVFEILAAGAIYLIFGVVAAYKTKSYPDPWGLRREISVVVCAAIVILFGFILGSYNNPPPNVVYDHQFLICGGMILTLGWLTIAQVAIAYVREGDVQERRARQRLLRKNQRQRNNPAAASVKMEDTFRVESSGAVSVSEKLNVKSILANPIMLKAFESFLTAELGVESLLFLRDSENWRLGFVDLGETARVARSKRIYNLYINTSGTLPINIPASTSSQIKNAIAKADITQNLFDVARDDIMDLLQAGAVFRFHASQFYPDHAVGSRGGGKVVSLTV